MSKSTVDLSLFGSGAWFKRTNMESFEQYQPFDLSAGSIDNFNLDTLLSEYPTDSPQHSPQNSSPSSEQDVNGFFNALDELSGSSSEFATNPQTTSQQSDTSGKNLLNIVDTSKVVQTSNSGIPEAILSSTAFLPYTSLNLSELHNHQPPKNRTELETLLKKIANPSIGVPTNVPVSTPIPTQSINPLANQSLQNLQAVATSHFLAQQTMNQQQSMINQITTNAVQPPSKVRVLQNSQNNIPIYANTQNDQTSASLVQAFMLSQNQNPAQVFLLFCAVLTPSQRHQI